MDPRAYDWTLPREWTCPKCGATYTTRDVAPSCWVCGFKETEATMNESETKLTPEEFAAVKAVCLDVQRQFDALAAQVGFEAVGRLCIALGQRYTAALRAEAQKLDLRRPAQGHA